MDDNKLILAGYDSDLESDDKLPMGAGEDSVDSPKLRVSENDEPPAKRIRRQLEEPVLITRSKLHEK